MAGALNRDLLKTQVKKQSPSKLHTPTDTVIGNQPPDACMNHGLHFLFIIFEAIVPYDDYY